jgi:hypothetical protein
MVSEEALAEGAMIAARATVPFPSHGALAPSLPAPRIAVAAGAASDAGLEVVLRHPTPYAPDDNPLGEAGPCLRCSVSCAAKVRTLLTSVGTSSCGPACSRGRWRGHDNMALTCRWRPSSNATPTPSGPLLTRRSCTHRPRPGPVPSSSKRRTSLCAHARSTNGRGRWKSWRGSCRSGRCRS